MPLEFCANGDGIGGPELNEYWELVFGGGQNPCGLYGAGTPFIELPELPLLTPEDTGLVPSPPTPTGGVSTLPIPCGLL